MSTDLAPNLAPTRVVLANLIPLLLRVLLLAATATIHNLRKFHAIQSLSAANIKTAPMRDACAITTSIHIESEAELPKRYSHFDQVRPPELDKTMPLSLLLLLCFLRAY